MSEEFVTPDMQCSVDGGIDTVVVPNEMLPNLAPPVAETSMPIEPFVVEPEIIPIEIFIP